MMKLRRGVDAMRALPIFKPEMRQANRDGRKSQTRRVERQQDRLRWIDGAVEYLNQYGSWQEWVPNAKTMRCPYGKVGDVVYMREPLVQVGAYAFYKDDNQPVISLITGEMVKWRWKVKTLSGMFMPGEAARFIYRYESVRVERVQEISEADAIAEGIKKEANGYYETKLPQNHYASAISTNSAIGTYKVLWDAINSDRGYGWHINPWVWVLEYTPIGLSATSPKSKTDLGEEGRGVR